MIYSGAFSRFPLQSFAFSQVKKNKRISAIIGAIFDLVIKMSTFKK